MSCHSKILLLKRDIIRSFPVEERKSPTCFSCGNISEDKKDYLLYNLKNGYGYLKMYDLFTYNQSDTLISTMNILG